METTTRRISEIIRESIFDVSTTETDELNVHITAQLIADLMQPWKPMDCVPPGQPVDLLGAGVMRFCNCRFDRNTEKWYSTIRFMDANNQPQVIRNHVLNPVFWMSIPPSPLLQS